MRFSLNPNLLFSQLSFQYHVRRPNHVNKLFFFKSYELIIDVADSYQQWRAFSYWSYLVPFANAEKQLYIQAKDSLIET